MPKLNKNPVSKPPVLVENPPARGWRAHCNAFAERVVASNKLQRGYALFGIFILVSSCLMWGYLGAHVQQANADQLADPLLFGNANIFHNAAFPAQHSFLLKWPVFYLIKLAGYSQLSFTVATMGLVLATIGLFAYMLYRIDRRPLIFGTLCLGLASCLLLVPAQPYAGAMLPVNMAMITTRNLEYVVYIVALIFLARLTKLFSWRFWAALIVLALVCASDRLFLDISLGGALVALLIYSLRQRWSMVSLSVNWLLLGLIAGIVAIGGLQIINLTHTTHIVGQAGVSPYASTHTIRGVALALFYGVSDLFTNFGANPAYDGTIVRQIPGLAHQRLISLSGISFVINALILLFGLLACGRLLLTGLIKSPDDTFKHSLSFRLATMMIWSSLAGAAIFIVSNHDYAVDGRYLTICLFTVFIALATYGNRKPLHVLRILAVAVILSLGIAAAIPTVMQTHLSEVQAQSDTDSRNRLVAQTLTIRHATTIVGDYWRVLPIKAVAGNSHQLTALPLQSCTEARSVLTSQSWHPDLHHHAFAYLLSFDKSLTDYPQCDLQQVTKYYGRPNATQLIAGTLSKPTELLLFYDQGMQRPTSATTSISTVLPIKLDELMHTSCSVPTVMNIVAHQDDDLLFMNPDTQHEIKAGHCVRSVYITAGDDGQDRGYWFSRELGSEAAYSAMTGNKQPWTQRVVELNSHEYVTIANPRGNNRISLIFFRLPDGGLTGQGFASTHAESLAGLYRGRVGELHSVDGQSTYNSEQLIAALSNLLTTYKPTIIRTQSSFQGSHITDHSDHEAVGLFVQKAYRVYEASQFEGQMTVPIKYYIGYPIREFAANINPVDLAQKQSAFLQYALFDGSVCHSASECDQTPTYGGYLRRQYQNPN